MMKDFELNIPVQGAEDTGDRESSANEYFQEIEAVEEEGKENDLAAQSLIKRIETGEKISDLEQEQIKKMCRDIDNFDKKIRADFLFALMDNPGKVSDATVSEAIMCLGSINPESVLEMKEIITEGKDIAKAIKNIKILQYLFYQNDYEFEGLTAEDSLKGMQAAWDDYQQAKSNDFKKNGFYERREDGDNHLAAMMAARIVLESAKKESENFFIKAEIEQELEDIDAMQKDTERMRGEYDNAELKNNYNIPPVFAEIAEGTNAEYVKQMTEDSTYSRLNDKYAVIYNPNDLGVDSFFPLTQEKGQEMPKRLDIKDILGIEGFKKEEIAEDDYKRLVLTYKTLIELPLRDKIEKEFEIKLKDYSVREQVQFVDFLSSKSVQEVEEVKDFLDKGGDDIARKNRIKSFLSLEAGKKMSESIFGIGETLNNQEAANAIFAKYAEIVDMAGRVKEELFGMVKEGEKSFSQKEIDSVSGNLIEKANDLLVKFSSKVKITKDAESIMDELDNYNADLLLNVKAFKALKQSGEPVNPEDLEGVAFHRVTAAQLINSDILAQMKKIYSANYDPEFGKVLVDGFQKLVDGDEGGLTNVYYYEKNGKVVAFCRFDKKGDDTKYFGSCNVLESIKGDLIGSSMVETALNQETAGDESILANCMFETSVSSCYIEKMGFVAKAAQKYKGSKETLLAIERNGDNGSYEYRSGRYGVREIVAENKKFPDNNYEDGIERMVLKYGNNESGINSLMSKSNGLFSEGYVMTRYIFDGDDVYCAFELENGGR
ncbi:MAG: hypothetical protein WCX69_01780 [Candidatus Paceibacterota bacterium]